MIRFEKTSGASACDGSDMADAAPRAGSGPCRPAPHRAAIDPFLHRRYEDQGKRRGLRRTRGVGGQSSPSRAASTAGVFGERFLHAQTDGRGQCPKPRRHV